MTGASLIGRLELNTRAALARSYVRWHASLREPEFVLMESLFAVLNVAAYVYLYRALKAPPEFVGFVILGAAMTAYWLNVLWSMASQFYWEKMSGQLVYYMIIPASRMALLLGMALGGIIYTSVRAVTIFVVGLLIFGVPFPLKHPFPLLGMFVLTMIALYGLGMLFSSLYLMWGREAWHLSNMFQEPIYLVSGFYFPVRALGFWLASAASIIPATLGLDAFRQLTYGNMAKGFIPVEAEALILAVLAVLFLYLADRFLARMETLGKTYGTLTLRGQ
jgi:ABC-2 type transport system permease protein